MERFESKMNTPMPQRMKTVCVIAPLPPPNGGMSLQAEKLISNLVREGLSVRVMATNPQPPRALAWTRKVPGFRTLIREVQFLILLLRELPNSDVVHHLSASDLYFFLHSVPTLILGSLFRKKTILNYRGGRAPEFLSRWHLCVVPFMRLADRIAVPSEFLALTFQEYGLKTTLLPNIADTGLFRWQDRLQFAPRLLVTRRLDPMYNIECVLKAFRIVKSRCPDAFLTIAGDGTEERRLRGLVNSWDLKGVHFCGAVPHRDLAKLYASHDICVNSSNVDNFPGSLVEAASSGLPIVTTRAGGIPSMIRNRHNGILVELNDHSGLAAGVIEIIERPQFGRALAREARLWVEQFSWTLVWPVLLNCYDMSNCMKGVIPADTGRADSNRPAEMNHHELVR